MCFTRKPYDKVRANIAEKDIIVYKWLVRSKYTKNLHSVFRGAFKWEKGKLFRERNFPKTMNGNKKTIDYGFHSLLSIQDAVQFRNDSYEVGSWRLYKICIPKGAYYYINDTQIVADRCYLCEDTPVRIRKK